MPRRDKTELSIRYYDNRNISSAVRGNIANQCDSSYQRNDLPKLFILVDATDSRIRRQNKCFIWVFFNIYIFLKLKFHTFVEQNTWLLKATKQRVVISVQVFRWLVEILEGNLLNNLQLSLSGFHQRRKLKRNQNCSYFTMKTGSTKP